MHVDTDVLMSILIIFICTSCGIYMYMTDKMHRLVKRNMVEMKRLKDDMNIMRRREFDASAAAMEMGNK